MPRVPRDGSVFTLGVGVNDLHRRVCADEFGDRLAAFVRGVRARAPAPIVVTNLPDVSVAPIVPASLRPLVAYQVRAYNDIIGRVEGRHRITLVGAFTPSRGELPDHPEFFSEDGFHPSDAGYRFWAGVIWPELRATPSGPRPRSGRLSRQLSPRRQDGAVFGHHRPPRSTRVHLGELRPEEEHLRRVVDPDEQHRQRAGRAEG